MTFKLVFSLTLIFLFKSCILPCLVFVPFQTAARTCQSIEMATLFSLLFFICLRYLCKFSSKDKHVLNTNFLLFNQICSMCTKWKTGNEKYFYTFSARANVDFLGKFITDTDVAFCTPEGVQLSDSNKMLIGTNITRFHS